MASDAAPRYRQVADALQRGIAAGDLGSHDRLASERAIADRFGLSRMTARQAVELLVRRGVVYRRPGLGHVRLAAPDRAHAAAAGRVLGADARAGDRAPAAACSRCAAARAIDAGRAGRARARPTASAPGWCAGSASATASHCCSRRSGCRAPCAPSCPATSWREARCTTSCAAATGSTRCTAARVDRADRLRAATPATWAPAPARRRSWSPARRATRDGRAGRVRPRPLPRRPRPLRAHAARVNDGARHRLFTPGARRPLRPARRAARPAGARPGCPAPRRRSETVARLDLAVADHQDAGHALVLGLGDLPADRLGAQVGLGPQAGREQVGRHLRRHSRRGGRRRAARSPAPARARAGRRRAKCSIRMPMNRSNEPNSARWIIAGRCSALSSPV